MFVQNGHLVVDYNAFDKHTVIESDAAVPVGDSTLTVKFRRGDKRSGAAFIEVDGIPAGQADLSLYMRTISSVGASVGYDHGSAVSNRYEGPFPFSGTLHELEIQLLSRADAATTEAEARAAMSRQ